MGAEGGVNPSSATWGAELHVQSETVNYNRELPETVNYNRELPETVNYNREPLPVTASYNRELPETVNYNRELPEKVNYNREPLPVTANYPREPPPPYSVSASAPAAVTTQPTIHPPTHVIVQGHLGNRPTLYKCPQCNERVVTKVKHVTSQKTHVVAGFLCGIFCWCFLCCLAAIPYLTTAFKTAEHYCPNCKIYLGKSSASKW